MITDDQVKAIEALGAKYPGHPMAKFCVDPMRWDREFMSIYSHINNGAMSTRTLDIGCGFGYLTLWSMATGGTSYAIDIAEPIIVEATSILNVKLITHQVTAYERLPYGGRNERLSGSLNLVTMCGCNLRHGHPASLGGYWGWDEYRFLIEDVVRRLHPTGRFVIRPNVMGDEHAGEANLLARDTFTDKIGDIAGIEYEGLQITLWKKRER